MKEEKKPTIYTKLLEFQKQNISVTKDGNNPHFKSKYSTLNEVLDKVKTPLNKIGVLIIFMPEEAGLRTILHDTESSTQIEGFMRYVGCDNAQKLLACNTYFRRGTLVSMLGLEDEDDDGNAASGNGVTKQYPARESKPLLEKGSEQWKQAVNHLLKGTVTMEQIKGKYTVLEPNENELIELTTKSVK